MTHIRLGSFIFLLTVMLSALGAPAWAQSGPWAERRYDPPVGSKWSIVSDLEAVETRAAGERRDRKMHARGEVRIDEKVTDGYRVTYVNRELKITGNAPGIELMQTALGAVTNITVRGRLDASGKPVAVENIDEVKSTMRTVVARMVSGLQDKPKVAELVRQMMSEMLIVDGKEAAKLYMDELPSLAVGQNTDLKPGEVRRETGEVASPLGGSFKTVDTTRLAAWDNAAGTARLVRRTEFDPESLKAVTLDLAKKFGAAADAKITPEVIEMMNKIKFSIDSETTLHVRNGMTHLIEDRSTTTASAMGHTFTKVEKKTVTVTALK